MKRFFVLIGLLLLLTTSGLLAQSVPRSSPVNIPYTNAFIHLTTSANNVMNFTEIDNGMTNGNADSVLFVTHNYSGLDTFTEFNDAFGVWRNFVGDWTIFDQNSDAFMPQDIAFNVQVQGLGGNVFRHVTAPSTIDEGYSYIDHPMANGRHDAILIYTPVYTAANPVYIDNFFSVWYNTIAQQWAFYVPGENIPTGLVINVQVLLPETHPEAFVHIVTPANKSHAHITALDHPALNNNPRAMLMVSSQWNPPGSSGIFNNYYVGLWYNPGNQRWSIYNQNGDAMSEGSAFNIHIVGFRDETDYMLNGSFEAPASGSHKHAAGWNFAGKAVRKCDKYTPNYKAFGHGGECALQMKGLPGVNSKAVQQFDTTDNRANLTLMAHVRANNVNSGANIVGKATLEDSSVVKLKFDKNFLNSGTYGYTLMVSSAELASPLRNFKVKIVYKGASGKLWVDDVRTYYTNTPILLDMPDTLALPLAPGANVPVPGESASGAGQPLALPTLQDGSRTSPNGN